MITENLSTLKIHKLSQAQYERELDAGRLDENAIYITPDEVVESTITSEQVFNSDGTNLTEKINTEQIVMGNSGARIYYDSDVNAFRFTFS